MQHRYIVLTGNPVTGLTFHGPFEDEQEAQQWVEGKYDEWLVAPLERALPYGTIHLNVYERNRAYGGPEEGEWWYDTGTYQPRMSVTFDADVVTWAEAHDHADRMQERLDEEADTNQVPPVGYSNYRGGRYLVIVDSQPGADFPAERPVYS